MSSSLSSQIVIDSLKMATDNRANFSGCIFHSDRGVQYTSKSFRDILVSNNIKQSMSRKGNCWDNAVAESFFKTLKYDLKGIIFHNQNQARIAIFDYIELFYNKKRIHSSLQY